MATISFMIQVFLTSLWWSASLTVFLPFALLLKFCKPVRDRWFSLLYINVIVPIFAPKMKPMRKRVFDMLKNRLSSNKKEIDILEIGIGGGGNLEYYPPNSRLTALDMNASFEAYFLENAKKYPDITYNKAVICKAEDMRGKVEDDSMDVVVCTSVLCSVDKVSAVLSEVKRVLKPGGMFLFFEHVAFSDCKWGYALQLFTAPLWKLYFNGCNLGRDLEMELRKTGFSDIVCEKISIGTPVIVVQPHNLGIATK